MPQFKHLLDDKCPHCGAGVHYATISGTHCNGQQFEKIEYDCGFTIKHEPNFSKKTVFGACERSAEYREMMDNREAEKNKLEKFIKKMKVSDELKKTLLDEISFPMRNYF